MDHNDIVITKSILIKQNDFVFKNPVSPKMVIIWTEVKFQEFKFSITVLQVKIDYRGHRG